MTDNILGDNSEPKSYAEELVGESKKFKDIESLAKGKYESDRFIELQNKRFDELRDQYATVLEESKAKAKLEDLIEEYKSLASTAPPQGKEVTQPATKPDDIRKLVSEEVTTLRRQDQERINLDSVQAKLKEQLGDNYSSVVRERIRNIGLSEQDFHDWARKSPTAVLNAIGVNENTKQETFQAPPQTTRTFKPVTEQKRTWSYYQELKKNNPKVYYDKSIMNQMLEDAERLGPQFEDGDFNTRNV